MQLIGTEILLREYIVSDSKYIYKWRNNKQTTLWMGRKFRDKPKLLNIKDNLLNIINNPPNDALYLAIADIHTNRYIGGIDLTSIDPIDKNAILSIVIGSETDRNKGYATEAIELLLTFAFTKLKLHKVSLNVYDYNEAAKNCYKSIGFKIEGRIRDQMFVDNEYCDLLPMGILKSELIIKKKSKSIRK